MATRDSAGRFSRTGGSQASGVVASLSGEFAKAARAFILEVDANLRASPDAGGTPVDTGHARANWVPSVGAPNQSEVSGNAAHEAGVAALLAYQLAQGDLYESNNVSYINALDLGTSSQAPAGFVESAIARALVTVQGKYDGMSLDVTTSGAGTFSDAAGGAAAGNMAAAFSPFGGHDD